MACQFQGIGTPGVQYTPALWTGLAGSPTISMSSAALEPRPILGAAGESAGAA